MAEAREQTQSQNFIPLTEEETSKAVQEYRKKSLVGYFFPVLGHEWKRLRQMCVMFCMISFSYALLRLFKDRIVYSVLDNTETKNCLKLLTFLVTQWLVTFAQNVTSKTDFNNAFKTLTIYFAVFLAANTALMFGTKYLPIQLNDIFTDVLFLDDSLTTRGLKFLYPFMLVFNQWTYSLFYVLAEVIGSMMVSFCFMTYVNNNTTESQNKRFVRTLLFFSNLASLAAGLVYKSWVGYYEEKPKSDSDIWYIIFPMIVIVGYMLVLLLKKSLEKELLNQIVVTTGAPKKISSKKKKIGFRDSIALMFKSKFLLCMCGLSFFYNVSANLLETSNASSMTATANYFDRDRSFYATGFKSFDMIFTSIFTSIIVVSPISLLPDRIGIAFFAMVPLMIACASAFLQLFFAVTNLPLAGYDNIGLFKGYNSSSKYPLAEVVCGTGVQSAIKIAKYAFFDIVKELIAMKIDPSSRPLFKGVFDGSITKFGKCIGSVYGIVMLNIFECFDARYYFQVTFTIIMCLCIAWFVAIRYLSKSYQKAKENNTYMDPAYFDEKDAINFS